MNQIENNKVIAQLLLQIAMDLLNNKCNIILYCDKREFKDIADINGFIQQIPTGNEHISIDLFYQNMNI